MYSTDSFSAVALRSMTNNLPEYKMECQLIVDKLRFGLNIYFCISLPQMILRLSITQTSICCRSTKVWLIMCWSIRSFNYHTPPPINQSLKVQMPQGLGCWSFQLIGVLHHSWTSFCIILKSCIAQYASCLYSKCLAWFIYSSTKFHNWTIKSNNSWKWRGYFTLHGHWKPNPWDNMDQRWEDCGSRRQTEFQS